LVNAYKITRSKRTRTMHSAIARAAGTAGLLVCLALPLQAQGIESPDSVQRRNCRLAAQVLRIGEPHTERKWAHGYISSCANEGPAVLVERWQEGNEPEEVPDLVRASGRIRDARLYRGLTKVATDRSRPAAVRVGAMLVLAKYVDPGSAVWLTDLIPPDSIRYIRLIGSSTTARNQLVGAEPVASPVAGSVLGLLDEIAASRSSEPRVVWYAAAVLARRVRSDIELGVAH
jgi:hypothetical protein